MARISTISEQYPIFELYEVAKELKVAFIRGFCPSNHIMSREFEECCQIYEELKNITEPYCTLVNRLAEVFRKNEDPKTA